MSYSRWSNSFWYSFYLAGNEDKGKDEQVLCLWPSISETKDWSYKTLKEAGKEKGLANFLKENYSNLTEDNINEAIYIINKFYKDVEKGFQ